MGKRPSPEQLRENDIVHFIVNVRKISATTTDPQRSLKLVFNLANTMFRHYIGYAGAGAYRLKLRGERCVAADAELASVREQRRREWRGEIEAQPPARATEPPRPRPLVEDASEEDLEFDSAVDDTDDP